MFSTGSCRYVSSNKSFLFSLYNINGYVPVKVNIKSGYYSGAIRTCSGRGPAFGAGHDWWIANNAASNRNSYTYCGSSYPLPPGYSASGASCQFYAGSYKFTPTDVEVFYLTTTVCLCKLVCWLSQLSRTWFGKTRNESDHLEILIWNSSLLFSCPWMFSLTI